MIVILQHFTAVFAGLTLGYWITMVTQVSQDFGYLLAGMGGLILLFISLRFQDRENDSKLIAEIILFIISITLAIFTSCLYAFNRDDGTYFHRVNHLLSHGAESLPDYDTRFAFDRLPPISAAHLTTSWEYILSVSGSFLGSAAIGYQIGGTFISILFYIAAALYTLKHFFPKASPLLQVFSIVVLIGFLIFDADQNRHIGSWLFLRGWTGRCFLAAALIILFPATDKALETNDRKDWFFVFCLIIFFLGLTGSALFIISIGLGVLILIEIIVRRNNFSCWYKAFLLLLIPCIVGGVFIYKFGGIKDDSYWRRWTPQMPFLNYIKITFADRQLWLYVGLIPVLLNRTIEANSQAIRTFALYQVALGLILINPYIVNILQTVIPPDGFWRTYYLFQYPTLIILLSAFVFHAVAIKSIRLCLIPGVALLLSLYGAVSIFTLQKAWGYPKHFKDFTQPKLEERELESVQETARKCPAMSKGAIVLAPEMWEVTVQLLFPSVTTVAARHMRHNFLNTKIEDISVSESIRREAAESVSGTNKKSIDSFKSVLERRVDIVVVSKDADELLRPSLFNYKRTSSDEAYSVYCLNERGQDE